MLLTGEAGHRQVAAHARAAGAACGRSRIRRSIYHCSPYHQDSALHPIIGQLLRAAGIERDDSAESEARQARNLAGAIEREPCRRRAAVRRAAVDPGWRPLSAAETDPAAAEGAHLRRAARPAEAARRTQPVLMMFEDLHWVDPTSLELLSLAVDQAPGLRLLLLATAGPEFTPPWPSHRHISTVALSRLDDRRRGSGRQV